MDINKEEKVHIIESYVESVTCGCCKDIIEKDDILHIILSCGHQYHYDCIYDAFIGNQKRGKLILECPYCRKKVNPLPEKEGFNYNSCIHSGLLCYGHGNHFQYKWTSQHLGDKYCIYCKKGKYCNNSEAFYGFEKKYCWTHHNKEHLGQSACKYLYKNNKNFCNAKVEYQKEYCVNHKEYVNVKYCKYTFQHGKNKGEMCNEYTFDDNCLCNHHNKYKDKIMNNEESKISCLEIIKTGINKGKICGIVNCKRHKTSIHQNMNHQINNTKIIELKGINDAPVQVEVEKTIDSEIHNYVDLNNTLGEIKDIFINYIYPELSLDKKSMIETLMSKFFK